MSSQPKKVEKGTLREVSFTIDEWETDADDEEAAQDDQNGANQAADAT